VTDKGSRKTYKINGENIRFSVNKEKTLRINSVIIIV